ncbi:MAG: hypothetical protein TREMPRED_003746 [Tremellales sp. Tagirdzhanova-0007]|nr:MAG: hypothetical protein TREMPRED_003746 [Tremellales sp. Tagirdzhanova-0007]
MPRLSDSPQIRTSKTLAYILRHGAEKEGLAIRSDGFVKLKDVLARPKMRDANIEMILQLVEENAKQRFEVMYGYDPSPIRPKSTARSRTKAAVKTEPVQRNEDVDGAMDAATIEDAKVNLAKSDQSEPKTELPLVIAPFPNEDGAGPVEGSNYEYFIRATQGHSLKLESTAHLTTVFDDDEGLQRIGLMVHGTRWDLWESIKEKGLSRMSRQHIHLAPALFDHRITPRSSSTLFIYLDLGRLLAAGIPVYTSANGVLLTPGNKGGFVPTDCWKMAERVVEGQRVVVWESGREVL